ncbi:hypothetical protein FA13DRAFT_1794916 [Coprinellus micaceus]|uniref:MYND-type domain-containing protein n=1 Tax=Coprinellus micaceus TaxID=71717 RepID=A0A4Y7SZL8_COPMI|nr:hypothetical protein FA13DRAFT_1794916 [Coprinellus micaceus]
MPLPSRSRNNPHDERKQRLLQAVANGSHAAQMALTQYIQATHNVDVAISRVVIQFLHPRLVPSTLFDNGNGQHVLAATGAMSVISTQCRLMITNGSDTRDMVELLTEHCMHFVRWFHFFKKRGAFIVTSGAFLWMMVNMDPGGELQAMLLSSRSAVDLTISLWTRRDQNGQHFFPDDDDDDDDDSRCPMLVLLEQIMHDEMGRLTFLNLLHSTPSKAVRMSRTIRSRIQNIGDRHLKGQMSTSCALQHLVDLAHLMRGILYRAIGVLPYFLEPLQSPKLFFAIFQALDTILPGHAGSVKWSSVIDILYFVFELVPDLGDGNSNPVAKVRAAVDGGFLRVSIFLLLHLPIASAEYSFVLDSMASIIAYAPYSDVAASLCKSIAGLNSDVLSQATARSPRLLRYWEAVVQARTMWDEGLGPRSPYHLCHYVEHSQDAECTPPRPGKSMMCQQCRAVAYCSTQCQKLDWAARHREECPRMQTHSLDQGVCECLGYDEQLPLKYQADLARFVQRIAQSNFSTFEDIHHRGNFQAPLHSLLLVVDGLATPLTMNVASKATFYCHDHLFPRIQANLTQHIEEFETYLVNASFLWGLLVANVLVKLRRDDQKNFHAKAFQGSRSKPPWLTTSAVNHRADELVGIVLANR